jgi:hypothetical protein
MPIQTRVTLERSEGGTQVNVSFDMKSCGFFKLVEPLLVSWSKRQYEGDLTKLKRLMEGHGS